MKLRHIKKGIFAFINIALILALFAPSVQGIEMSTDITEQLTCEASNGMPTTSTTDDNYNSYWYTNKASNKSFEIVSKKFVSQLYVCYAFKPTELIIQTSIDGIDWVDSVFEPASEFYHVLYTFDEATKYIRIKAPSESIGKFGISEIKAFTEGEVPSYVQQWEPTYDTADMLIFSAHPDDEAVFFSGLIPYYSGEMDKKVTVVYMTASDPCRRSEPLNYLWTMHETHLPIYGYFEDVFEENGSGYTKKIWGEKKTLGFLVSTIRRMKPAIIVSHDINGEYGHGNHIYTAKSLQKAVLLANDPTYHLESYEKYGIHETKKLYLHLYDQNQIHLDVFDEPLDEYDGLTAIEAAKIGILEYVSQLRWTVVRVHDADSAFSCYDFGLAYTTVGQDKKGNDMFENIEPIATPTPEPTTTPSPTPTSTAQSTSIATFAPTFTPTPASVLPISQIAIITICVIAGLIFSLCIMLAIMIVRKKRLKK